MTLINNIRVTLTVVGDYNPIHHRHCDVKGTDFRFHVKSNNPNVNNKEYNIQLDTYTYVPEEYLCDMCHKSKVIHWKKMSVQHYLNNWNEKSSNVRLSYPDDDLEDPDFVSLQPNRGHYGLPVYVYFKIKDGSIVDYESQQDQLQISAIGYHKKWNKFYGLVLHPDGRKSHEEVDENWIKENDWQQWYQTDDIIEFIKANTDQSKTSHFRCGWGFSKMSNSPSEVTIAEQLNEFFIKDEIINFQQQGEPTCAFTSLASMLFMKSHFTESEAFLATVDSNHARLEPGKKPDAILAYIADFFNSNDIFKCMRGKQFRIQSLDTQSLKDFNIVEWDFLDNEFLLGIPWGSNGFYFHVICFTKNMIIDGNHRNALQLNQEVLDIICQSSYQRIHSGLYFHNRPVPPFEVISNKKRKRQRKRKLKEEEM